MKLWETGDSVNIHCASDWWDTRGWWYSGYSVCFILVRQQRLVIQWTFNVCETGDVETGNSWSEQCCSNIHCGHKTGDAWQGLLISDGTTTPVDIHQVHGSETQLWLTPDGNTISLDNMQFTISMDIDMAASNGSRWQYYFGGYSLARGNTISFSLDIHWQGLVFTDGDIIPMDCHFVHMV